jgi:PEP-CTERM motif
MKLKSLLAIAALLVTSLAASASITINLGGAELFQSNGTTPIPTGSLIQLVVSTTNTAFDLPTPTSFTGGSADDQILASFGSNDSSGPGSFLQPVVFNLDSAITTGDQLLLRWWPTLTTASSSPGNSTPFGQFRTDNVENFSTINWTVPADGTTNDLNFLDQAAGGTEPNSAGTASFMTAAIPEPSVLALLGVGAVLVAVRGRAKV